MLTLGEGAVVDSEGEGTVVGGVVTEGVGGVVFNCPSSSPHPTVSIAIVRSVDFPLTTAVFLKLVPTVAEPGILSSV